MFAAMIFCAMFPLNLPVAHTDSDIAVTWVNHTGDVRQLVVDAPDTGRLIIGSFTRGGSLSVTVRRNPAIIYWRAGDQSGAFEVGPDTPNYLRIDITRRGYYGP